MINDDEAWEFLCAVFVIVGSLAVGCLVLGGVIAALVHFLT